MTPFTVRQLIYTNVEAAQSPTRERGLQIWRYSASLSNAEQRRAIARRLGDFKLPPGAAAEMMTIERHQSYPVEGVGHVIARAVPLPDKDQFGRGGRFIAHALVFTDDEFAKIGYDPFRIFGFGTVETKVDFISHPRQAMPEDGSRPDALIEDVLVTPVLPEAAEVPLNNDLWGKMLAHFVGLDLRPIVIPDPPRNVLVIASACIQRLPPVARKGFAFDSLSTGTTLARETYPLAGGYSQAAIRMWSFRKYHELLPNHSEFKPPLTSNLILPANLLVTSGWTELTDPEQTLLFDTGSALAKGETGSHIDFGQMTDAATAVLIAAGVTVQIQDLVEVKIKAIPKAFASLPSVMKKLQEHFAFPLSQTLSRLSLPIPNHIVDDGLVAELFCDTPLRPSQPLFDALTQWVTEVDRQPSSHLRVAFMRWRLEDKDFEKLSKFITQKTEPRLSEWLASTLCFDLTGIGIETDLKYDMPCIRIREIRLWLQLNRDDDNFEWVRATLNAAYHAGVDAIDHCWGELQEVPSSATMAREWLSETLFSLCLVDSQIGWMKEAKRCLQGIFASISDKHRDRILCLYPKGDRGIAENAMRKYRSNRNHQNDELPDCVLKPYSKVPDLCEQLLAPEPPDLVRTRNKLTKMLSNGTFSDRMWALKELRGKAQGLPQILEWNGYLFCGIAIKPRGHTFLEGYLYLFEALAALTGEQYNVASETIEDPQIIGARRDTFWKLFDCLK